MSRPTTILTVGLTMEAVHFITPDMDTVKLKKRLDDSMDTLKTVSNLYSDCFWIDHNAPPEAPNSVQNYKKLVDQGPPQGGHWDGHIMGGAVRLSPKLTVLLEKVVDIIIKSSKGETRVLFSDDGTDHWQIAKRAFPHLNMGEKPATG